ncbi:MAG TPA: DUF512 domain-containing protein [Blastocatellia bacterium]|nr:DUF512 domain-containing protein [Blastocatellia bacterium]
MYSEIFETLYPINLLKKEKGVQVTAVDPCGIGSRIGLEPGDRIMRANGRDLRDFLDFQFETGSEEQVCIEYVRKTGEVGRADVQIGEGEIWGLDFEYFSPRQCANDCIFCFCNQNPAGSRESLFFKDEDTRLSFLHGNYTTMSSISKMELDRIVEQRLSPQYVSVHATDPEVRRYLLGRKRPDRIMDKLRYLSERGIELHAQIVLCPTINSGEVLDRTLEELSELHPSLRSVAVVPVVVTSLHNYRDLITPVTDDFARELVTDARKWQRRFRKRLGTSFVFLADELYLRAGLPVPGASHYGDYPQIEDGVGMVRRFVSSAERTLRQDLAKKYGLKRGLLDGTVATGELFYPILSRAVDRLNSRWGTKLRTIAVKNQFFGQEINVAGLLAGSDILASRDAVAGSFLIVPEQSCLKSGNTFLDDLTVQDIGDELNIHVSHGGGSLASLVEQARSFDSR